MASKQYNFDDLILPPELSSQSVNQPTLDPLALNEAYDSRQQRAPSPVPPPPPVYGPVLPPSTPCTPAPAQQDTTTPEAEPPKVAKRQFTTLDELELQLSWLRIESPYRGMDLFEYPGWQANGPKRDEALAEWRKWLAGDPISDNTSHPNQILEKLLRTAGIDQGIYLDDEGRVRKTPLPPEPQPPMTPAQRKRQKQIEDEEMIRLEEALERHLIIASGFDPNNKKTAKGNKKRARKGTSAKKEPPNKKTKAEVPPQPETATTQSMNESAEARLRHRPAWLLEWAGIDATGASSSNSPRFSEALIGRLGRERLCLLDLVTRRDRAADRKQIEAINFGKFRCQHSLDREGKYGEFWGQPWLDDGDGKGADGSLACGL